MKDNKKIVFIALTSSFSAISDGFKGLNESLVADSSCYWIGTRYSLRDEKSPRTLIVRYARGLRAIIDILHLCFLIRNFVKTNSIDYALFYSTLPVNGLVSFFLPRNVQVNLWLHDPIVHSGESAKFSFAKKMDEHILVAVKPYMKVLVASTYLKKLCSNTIFKNKSINVVPFCYLSSLGVNSEKPIKKIKGRVILFGRMEAYKGIDWFFYALSRYLPDSGPISEICIFGKGNLPESVFQFSRPDINLIVRNEFIEADELREEIACSELAVFPYRDATSTQAIQSAGAVGCKILATNVGGLAELVNRDFGDVVEKDDAEGFINEMIRLLNKQSSSEGIRKFYLSEYSPDTFALAVRDAAREDGRQSFNDAKFE